MWPRRSQAAAGDALPAPASRDGKVPAAPAAASERGGDCGWLMRAVAKKSKKAKGAGEAGGKAAAKKRVRDADAPKPKAAKLPRGIGWSQPSKTTAGSKESTKPVVHANATSAPGESFDEVFAEVFGAAKRAKARAVLGEDDHVPSLPITTTVFAPDHSSADVPSSKKPAGNTAHHTGVLPRRVEKKPAAEDKWDFNAPTSIQLDDFDVSKSSLPHADDSKSDRATSQLNFARWKDEQGSHAISDNFVRLNMRKRFKGSSGKAKKRPDYMRSRGFADDDDKSLTSSRDKTADPPSNSSLDDGVDFIEECLEVLRRAESGQVAPKASSATPESADPPRCHHALVCQRVLVKKKNKNHGRAFFSCPMGFDEGRCDFFMWEENHTQFALHRLFNEAPEAGSTEGEPGLAASPPAYHPLDLSKPIRSQANTMLTNLRLVFGHSDFRPGQQWAIERVFERKRTLLVLPTGAGKSLCYQYPALFLPGVTIVISPLISLMNDQFHNLPVQLKHQATCVTTSSSSKTQYAEFVRDLLGGKLKLLFVSPEKALTSGFQRLLMHMQSRVSLVCVDEAHCISEWSHHFRPSYLRLQSIFALADSVLAITATASRRVQRDILSQLVKTSPHVGEDDAENGEHAVLRMPWQRDNLQLQVVRVSSDDERLERLCDLLTKSSVSGAIIMYVHQQWQAEAMANLLQERLVMDGGGSKTAWTKHKIASYHAKMDPETKEKVRLGFLSGRVKLVIATIAFGMGIDKQNVRLVIHYHVPSSIEHYLQQVGRAGRDGRHASALLYFLDDDVRAFRSLLFSNALHIDQVRRLLQLVTSATDRNAPGVVTVSRPSPTAASTRIWMDIAWLERHLDMKSAMLETFLTLISLDTTIRHSMHVTINPTAMSWCVISMMETQLKAPSTDPLLHRLVHNVMAKEDPAIGHVDIEVDGYLRHLRVRFHVAAAAAELFSDDPLAPIETLTRRLMQSVRAWQASGCIRKFAMETTAFDVSVQWEESAGRPRRETVVDEWTRLLYARHEALEAMELKRLQQLYSALSSAASVRRSSAALLSDSDDGNATHVLESKLSSYFDDDADGEEGSPAEDAAIWKALTTPLTPDLVEAIERDVEALTSRLPMEVVNDEDESTPAGATTPPSVMGPSTTWHGSSVARIFHGLASPCFPSKKWRDVVWWRKYNHVAFEQLVVIADKVLTSERQRGEETPGA